MGEHIHVGTQFRVDDFSVNLCRSDVCVSQHLGYALNGYAVTDTEGRKTMAGNVIGDFLVYAAHRCDFFQVIVHLLVADYRENFAVRQLPVIFLQDGFRNIQQADIGRYVCLVPFLDYSQVSVKGNLDILRPQLAHIHIRQARITAKNKHITHLFQPLAGKGFLIDAV